MGAPACQVSAALRDRSSRAGPGSTDPELLSHLVNCRLSVGTTSLRPVQGEHCQSRAWCPTPCACRPTRPRWDGAVHVSLFYHIAAHSSRGFSYGCPLKTLRWRVSRPKTHVPSRPALSQLAVGRESECGCPMGSVIGVVRCLLASGPPFWTQRALVRFCVPGRPGRLYQGELGRQGRCLVCQAADP